MDHNYEENNLKDVVVAIDLGTTKISALAGRFDHLNKLQIIAFASVASDGGIARGAVNNIEKTVESVNKVVAQLQRKLQTKVSKVYVGIAGMQIKSTLHRGMYVRENPDMEIQQSDLDKLMSDMYKLVLPPGQKILHIIPQEYRVDFESGIINPKGMLGSRLEADFQVISVPLMTLNNTTRCINKCGMEVAGFVLEPLASGAAVLSREEKEAGVALVDIGGGTTDLSIYSEGILRHSAIIPLGGKIITKDIKEGCNVLFEQAEDLKLKYGCAVAELIEDNTIITIAGHKGRDAKEISQRNLSRIIQARMEEILEYVDEEILQSGYNDKLTCGIVLTGGGAKLDEIETLTSLVTGLSARVGHPIDHLSQGYPDVLSDTIHSTGIGLIVNAIESKNPIYGLDTVEKEKESEAVLVEEEEETRSKIGVISMTKFRSIFKEIFDGDSQDEDTDLK
jgi:cell division protein FtsA